MANRCRLVSAVVISVLSGACSGNDLVFLPGDSFFHAIVTEQWAIDSVHDEQGRIVLTYAGPPQGGRFCGAYGVRELVIEEGACDVRTCLRRSYYELRGLFPKQTTKFFSGRESAGEFESNPVHIFICNSDFDVSRFRLFQRFNENWFRECENFGLSRHKAELRQFTRDEDGVDSRDGDLVAPLRTVRRKGQAIADGRTAMTIAISHEDLVLLQRDGQRSTEKQIIICLGSTGSVSLKALRRGKVSAITSDFGTAPETDNATPPAPGSR